MEPKKRNFQNKSNDVTHENGSQDTSGPPTAIVMDFKESNILNRTQIQKLEEENSRLLSLVEKQSEELSQVVQTNTRFISIISHDLRSPFNSILGVLDILKKSLKDGDSKEIQYHINMAVHSVSSTLNLLESLLAWAILQHKEKRINPVKVNIHELLAEELEHINISAQQKKIVLDHIVPPHLEVYADLQMVKTIIRNLVGNAIKYTSPGGCISISASKNASHVEVIVKDNGIGISPETQEGLLSNNAFKSTSGTHNERGVGLGLLLCKEFIEMHGGNMRINSELGKGSEFKFTLPAYSRQSKSNATQYL